ncbi:ATP-binding cassette domain-containing protein, partial [Sneathia sp. DSM 16630]|nr:ATP-binding cassette domain-containing protein [Sneathia sp. DSM 16630]
KNALIQNISFVFQNPKLFKISIYDNVKVAKPTATREEVMRALKLASCETILNKFKDRENTIIGSKGVYLSGGEIQRIAIARALLKDSKIILLDEASSAIDPDNEYELKLAISELIKDKTIIMIAHRLTSITNADEILVVENGKIEERGNNMQLMEKNQKYAYYMNLYHSANNWRVNNEKMD